MAVRIPVRVHPGQGRVGLRWDSWRQRWVIACRVPAVRGLANEDVRRRVASWLEVGEDRVRWVVAGRASDKLLEVEGLDEAQVRERLSAVEQRIDVTTEQGGGRSGRLRGRD